MPTTFVFEELDAATRDYLLAARARQGKGMPGVFVKQSNPLPVLGCILGPILIVFILIFTLIPTQIYNNPDGLACLQTAGLMLGGWMVLAAFRSWMSGSSRRVAGHWTYADPLNLYEANAEQVKVTPMKDIVEAAAVHNVNNGSYQNSVLKLKFADEHQFSLTLNDQRRAEAMVLFYNYLAWARGADGGERGNLPPAVLGGMAKYVAKNDKEPIEPDGGIDLNAVELDVQDVPVEPKRDGRAMPHFLMYLFILVAGAGCYFLMRAIDIPVRDDAIYSLVTTEPVHPVILRQYLADESLTRNREDIIKRLGAFYEPPIEHVRKTVRQSKMKDGSIKLLESLKQASTPVISMRITEIKTPPGKEADMSERVNRLREVLARTLTATFTRVWETQPNMPDVKAYDPPLPPLGDQLVAFSEAFEGVNAHIEIAYQFNPMPGQPGHYSMRADVTIRDDIEGTESWKGEIFSIRDVMVPRDDEERSDWAKTFADEITASLVGKPPARVEVPDFGGFDPK